MGASPQLLDLDGRPSGGVPFALQSAGTIRGGSGRDCANKERSGNPAEGFFTGSTSVLALSIPNIITLARVIMVPVVFWLMLNGQPKGAFYVFVLAGISDGVDGYLAKRFDWATELGAYLDPLADKLLIVCIFIALGVRGELPSWLVLAVVSRDVLIVIAIMLSWLLGNPVRIKPFIVSKANTLSQIVLAALVLADDAFLMRLDAFRSAMIWITGFLTFASLAAYLRAWLRHMSGDEASVGASKPE